MSDHLVNLLEEANNTLKEVVDADKKGKDDIAIKNYKKAFEQLKHYREEFDKQYLLHYKRAEDIARGRNPGSSITATAQLWRFPTDSSPKLSHFVKLSNVKLGDVGGLEDCKRVLREAAIWPEKYPQFFTGNRKPWRSVLLFGPPGSGKTLLAKAIAAEANFHFSSISPSDIVSKWMGESEQQVSDLFQEAREKAPSIIFIDEIDSLCGQRGKKNENEASRRIKSELLVHMQGVCDGAEHVLILAATNTPYDLDMRRFECESISLSQMTRQGNAYLSFLFEQVQIGIGITPSEISENELESLAKETEGFSGSDISSYVKDALYQSIRPTLRKLEKDGQNSEIQVPKIEFEHFRKVRERHKPTVDKKDLEKLKEFKEEFGVSGEM
uniref:AAA+ ATPase domain-containing protein n=1 Tax=Quercus lobata TaxID=97700 RepID=A0A7N2LJV8_QUELO